MAGVIDELLSALDQERECYESLVILAQYKTTAIVEKEIESLKDLTIREEEFLGRLHLLEEKNQIILNNMGLVLNLPREQVCLSSICEKLKDSGYKERLLNLKQKILVSSARLKEKNEQNKILLEQSLEMISFSMNALYGQLQPDQGNYSYLSNTQYSLDCRVSSNGYGNQMLFDYRQ